jgi:hypothetical protein
MGPSEGGSGLASYLLGDVSSFTRYVSNSLDAGERQTREFIYAQDTWRVTPKLTLNYGLRWEVYNPQTVTGRDKGGWLNISTGEMLVAGENGVSLNGGVKNSFRNFAPRLGIAYQFNDKTVVRMGYGRTFDVGTFGSIFGHSVTQNLPVLGTQTLVPSSSWQSVFNLAQGPPATESERCSKLPAQRTGWQPDLPQRAESICVSKPNAHTHRRCLECHYPTATYTNHFGRSRLCRQQRDSRDL